MNDTRELDQIQQELDQLQSRSNQNKQTISAHEAVCQERYEHNAKSSGTSSSIPSSTDISVSDTTLLGSIIVTPSQFCNSFNK